MDIMYIFLFFCFCVLVFYNLVDKQFKKQKENEEKIYNPNNRFSKKYFDNVKKQCLDQIELDKKKKTI